MRETKIRPDIEKIFNDSVSIKILLDNTKNGVNLYNNYLNQNNNKDLASNKSFRIGAM